LSGLDQICTNGTAVVVVCVTGAASRQLVLFVSSETVPVASQYGAIFAITVWAVWARSRYK